MKEEKSEHIKEIVFQLKLLYLELKTIYISNGKNLTVKEMFELLPNEK